MNKKYELTKETKYYYRRILYRIKALCSFSNVKAGDLGGWVESEANLSHKGDCWVYDEVKVFDKAWVCGEALVYGKARIFGEAWVFGKARVFEEAEVFGKARIYGNQRINKGYIQHGVTKGHEVIYG